MAQPVKMARIGIAEIFTLKTMTLPPYTATNTVIYGERNFVVVDPGTKEDDQRNILSARINERLKLGHKFLATCLTHHHGDHTGSAQFLKETFGAPIIAHHTAVGQVRFFIDKTVHDRHEIVLDDDSTLLALHSPGHARDHLVFYDEKHRLLIAGDMITDRGTILVPPLSGSLSIYLESLNALTKLAVEALIPAHGKVITDHPRKFLLTAMRHRYGRILAVLETLIEHREKPLDATEITVLVYHGNISDDLLTFAQLSVETTLRWLLEHNLITNTNYKWLATDDAITLKQSALLDPMEEINERLRNP